MEERVKEKKKELIFYVNQLQSELNLINLEVMVSMLNRFCDTTSRHIHVYGTGRYKTIYIPILTY